MKTTLNKILKHDPCGQEEGDNRGWNKCLKALGKTEPDDEELSLRKILEANGITDAIWALRAVDGYEREKSLFVISCASQVKHLMKDERSLKVLEVVKLYAEGKAIDEELRIVHAAAARAANEAYAWAAAEAAAWDTAAAEAAAWDTAAAAAAARYAARYAVDACAADVYAAAACAAYAGAHESQKKEFIRMLDCIESGKKYEI